MKKLVLLLTVMLTTASMFAQEYDLQGLQRTMNHYYPPSEGNYMRDTYNFHEGLVLMHLVLQDGDKWGFIDKFGKVVIPFIYEDASDFDEGLASVRRDGKYGFIDKSGRTIIPFIYNNVKIGFHDGIAIVGDKNGKQGVIDKSGNVVVPFEYDILCDYGDGLIFANRSINDKPQSGFINLSGDVVIPFGLFTSTRGGFSEGLAIAKTQGFYDNNGKYQKGEEFIIDKTGKKLFPFPSGSYKGFSEGLCAMGKQGKYGFVNKSGVFVISPVYDEVGDFHEGLARVSKGDKWGAIDKNGKIVVPLIYDQVGDFSEGLVRVDKIEEGEDKWGFVDRSGNVVIPIKYRSADDFSNGLASVMFVDDDGCKLGFIDKQGNSAFDY